MVGIGLKMRCAVIQQVLLLTAGSAAALAPHRFTSTTTVVSACKLLLTKMHF
jgi:hypothetical protein